MPVRTSGVMLEANSVPNGVAIPSPPANAAPSGLVWQATQSPARQRGLVVEEKAQRVARFHGATIRALHEIIVASGLDSPSDLRPSHLRQRINVAEMRQFDEIYPFARSGELIDGTDNAMLARWWNAASADTFRRVDEDRLSLV